MAKKDSYGKALRQAYECGWHAGWQAHEKLPKRFGAKIAAKTGFAQGMRAHKRSDRDLAHAKKS